MILILLKKIRVNVNPFSVHATAPPGTQIENPFSRKDLKQKEKELEKKEDELRRREREARRKEEELAKAGIFVEPKNWPSFYPIIHHDVMNDIPVHLQKMQYIAFASFLGMVVCFGWNILAVLVAIIRIPNYGVNILLLAILYFIFAVPGGYVMWHRPLYRAFRTDSGLKYGLFFIRYLIHLAMFFYATIAPPIIFSGRSISGIFSAMDVLKHDSLAGIFYLIGFSFFLIETLLSIWVIQQVYRYFRGNTSDAARREAAISLS